MIEMTPPSETKLDARAVANPYYTTSGPRRRPTA
jgi:hypothetical protein